MRIPTIYLIAVTFLLGPVPGLARADEGCWEKIQEAHEKYEALGVWGVDLHMYASKLESELSKGGESKAVHFFSSTLRPNESQVPSSLSKLQETIEKSFVPENQADQIPFKPTSPSSLDPKVFEAPPPISIDDLLGKLEPAVSEILEKGREAETLLREFAPPEDPGRRELLAEVRNLRKINETEFTPLDHAEGSMEALADIYRLCSGLMEFFGAFCDEELKGNFLPKILYSQNALLNEYTRVLGKASEERVWREKVGRFFPAVEEALARMKKSPLFRRDLIRVLVETVPNHPRVRDAILRIPVLPGEGFEGASDVWDSFFPRLKRTVEKFWVGIYVGEDGLTTRIRIEVVRSTTENGFKIHRATSLSGFAHVNLVYDEIIYPAIVMETESEVADMVIVHEMGHVLGFPDRYYQFLDQRDCAIRTRGVSTDVMSAGSELRPISRTQIEQIYDAYVRTPSINSNQFYGPLVKESRKNSHRKS